MSHPRRSPPPDRAPAPVQALGESEAFLQAQERISRAARTPRPVILIGERGTGKELAAARLHLLSPRWNAPYLTLNCAALSPTLIESELFGHEAGAFTGAVRQRKGRFELADGGTLFLDEVANIPATAQEKILRTIEYGQFERVGGQSTLTVDARLVAATNMDLRREAEAGRFRHDLLDRLAFEVITLPPLRARGRDVLLLAGHFARRMTAELRLEEAPAFTPAAQRALLDYPWPGNVRELKNVVERMVYRCENGVIDAIEFDPFESPWAPAAVCAPTSDAAPPAAEKEATPPESAAAEAATATFEGFADHDERPLPEALRAYEIARLRRALEASRYNQRQAAEGLGLTYHQFRGYYRKYQQELTGEG